MKAYKEYEYIRYWNGEWRSWDYRDRWAYSKELKEDAQS